MLNLSTSVLLAVLACAMQFACADPGVFFKAAEFDDPRAMQKLLAAGIDPNLTEPQRGDTALILALREESGKVFTLLLAQPAINLEAKSGNGDTALMLASYKHNLPAVQALLARGAHVNRPGWTALHYAAASGDDAILGILLENHAYIDAESPTRVTPLMMAAREGHASAVKLLLSEGADASLKSSDGMTAEQFAITADKQFIADAILAYRRAKP